MSLFVVSERGGLLEWKKGKKLVTDYEVTI